MEKVNEAIEFIRNWPTRIPLRQALKSAYLSPTLRRFKKPMEAILRWVYRRAR